VSLNKKSNMNYNLLVLVGFIHNHHKIGQVQRTWKISLSNNIDEYNKLPDPKTVIECSTIEESKKIKENITVRGLAISDNNDDEGNFVYVYLSGR